ncbi:Crp/Fnr family transcriptional regulator [Maribellus maritimus]|uniref:Crp/Fnr family transcriptional regulator n=1 Tax=Maribellus maritimus TaxID=2870838 RepID=UPI001EECB4A5|nr:Crp/Fnr family transcriptional regulator [Maribellus maritimus]MCG6186377.1 Crp/Fnr family transcriptional regulator [Maribellus maritimus]
MPDLLKDFINRYITLSENDWNDIKREFQKKIFSKDEIILQEGKVCHHFYFFERGLIRFFCNIDGEDITKTFALAPYCFTSKISFRNQSPANESIQALEKTVVWEISYKQYKQLEKINSWNIFMRKLLNEIQEFTEKLMLDSKVLTAEKRYEILQETYPADLLQKIPLKHLASFLGIAPQSLSRIRNNLHQSRKS